MDAIQNRVEGLHYDDDDEEEEEEESARR